MRVDHVVDDLVPGPGQREVLEVRPLVPAVQVRGGGGEARHGEDGGEPVRHVEEDAGELAGREEGGGVDDGGGPGAALVQRVLQRGSVKESSEVRRK